MKVLQRSKIKFLFYCTIFILGIFILRENVYADENGDSYNEDLQYGDYLDLSTIVGDDYEIKSIDTVSVTSYKVANGKVTSKLDESVVEKTSISDVTVQATGIGNAKILLENLIDGSEKAVDITVSPAKLTLMYVTGQSNAEGWCKDYSSYNRQDSIACPDGKVYSSYLVRNNTASKNISGLYNSNYYSGSNVSDFISGSLINNISTSGKNMEYNINTLTSLGDGKTGIDSGLAYEWNRMTGDKVWVINTAVGATSVSEWASGGVYYQDTIKASNCVKATFESEINAGHFIAGNKLMFWLQGESDRDMNFDTYKKYFKSMYNGLTKSCELDVFGMISVRSSLGDNKGSGDIDFSAARLVQYLYNSNETCSKAIIASNVNEQWISDAGVKNYFKNKYPNGINYPLRSNTTITVNPTKESEVHPTIHYTQVGHNENGISAADGVYDFLYNSVDNVTSVKFISDEGYLGDTLNITEGDTVKIIPVADLPYYSKKLTFIADEGLNLNSTDMTITPGEMGTYEFRAFDDLGECISTLTVEVSSREPLNISNLTGRNYTGTYYYKGNWRYVDKGWLIPDFNGLEKVNDDWVYFESGVPTQQFTGIVRNKNGDWLVVNGHVAFGREDVVYADNRQYDYKTGRYIYFKGWYYLKNGKIQYGSTTVQNNSNGWWYIGKDGKVDFSYYGFASNQNGTWLLNEGKVQFGVSGVIKVGSDWYYINGGQLVLGTETVQSNSNGWWYIGQDGRVDFTKNTVAPNQNGWWVIRKGAVSFAYSGLASNQNGTWYCEGGKVQFGVTDVIKSGNAWYYINGGKLQIGSETVQENQNGWWYIGSDGKVDFSKNTVASNPNGWWVIRNGKVDFTYNGLADNQNGTWYCVNGKVQFDTYSVVYTSKGWYYIRGGKLHTGEATVQQNQNGWWYINTDGKVDFSYTGVGSNQYGTWYIRNGKVDFSYSGIYEKDKVMYHISSGKVVYSEKEMEKES